MGGQWFAQLAPIDGTHLGTAPLSLWVSGIASTLFAVHPVLVDVRDVALTLGWLRGGWSAYAGWGQLGTHLGSLWLLLAIAAAGGGSDWWWGHWWWWWEGIKQRGNGCQAVSRFRLGRDAGPEGGIYLLKFHI